MSDSKPRKVAIVDDDAAVRHSLQFLLEVEGYAVEAFSSAVELLGTEMHQLACLILDYHLPHMTGLDLVDRLRTEDWDIPVLLMTGALSPAIIARAAELGVERVLAKPVSGEDLFEFVSAKCRGRPGGHGLSVS